MSMIDSRLKPSTDVASSDQVPGSSGPRWRIRCDGAEDRVDEVWARPSADGSVTKASSPHTAPVCRIGEVLETDVDRRRHIPGRFAHSRRVVYAA